MGYGIPSTEQIVAKARRRMEEERPGSLLPEYVRCNFSDSVEALFRYTYAVFQEYKGQALDREIRAVLDGTDKEEFTRDEVISMVGEIKDRSTRAEMSMRQSLMSRTRNTLEVIVQSLLGDLGISIEWVTGKDKKSGLHQIDLVIPDRDTAARSPDMAHFLAVKVSLKDRWIQMVKRQMPARRTHLLTLLQREDVSDKTVARITDSGIFLYVPDRIKDGRFAGNDGVRRMSDLPASVGA